MSREAADWGARPADRRSRPADRGSLAVELAIVAPALLALLTLVLSYGRFGQVTALLDAAARDGARAATQARTLDDAQRRVSNITETALAAAPTSCRDTAVGEVMGGRFEGGDDVTGGVVTGGVVTGGAVTVEVVTVEVRCTVTFSDLGAWGAPGDTTVVRRFSSPVDPNRGVR